MLRTGVDNGSQKGNFGNFLNKLTKIFTIKAAEPRDVWLGGDPAVVVGVVLSEIHISSLSFI